MTSRDPKEVPVRREQRTAVRRSLSVPVRLTVPARPTTPIDGQSLDVSEGGLGVKFASTAAKLDSLLEDLVEDRLVVEITLRLPQGSVTTRGQVVWWGLLGDDPRFAVRAGILLSEPWSQSDWQLIEKSSGSS